ncbi:MAG: rRNA pseudouridine synthase, partial [Candidatus Hydrogenedentes bacterium]|nr:rRNA pseudouridine synthase [Candidatus Hydrogenedentota bacterium]
FMAACGVASRRASEAIIVAARVTVNGQPATLGQSVDPERDDARVDGRPIRADDDKVYILLNKPRGVITSAKDTHGRKTVLDCVDGLRARVFPVGRLDYDVEGALLLTNDGELAYRLTHPKYGIEKVYLAWVKGRMTPETAIALERGVELDDGVTAPATVQILSVGERSTQVRLVLTEGRKREVKRMCQHVGHPVNELQRIAIAHVKVKGLKPGQWRHLAAGEVAALKNLTGLPRCK